MAVLLARNPAAHVPLENSEGVTMLLDALREAGAEEQILALVDRLPAEGNSIFSVSSLNIITRGTSSGVSSTEAQPRHGTGKTWADTPPPGGLRPWQTRSIRRS